MTFRLLRAASGTLAITAVLALLAAGCGPTAGSNTGQADANPDDIDCDPALDDDSDCLTNAQEGCGMIPPPDTDGDGAPDLFDIDSDNDGVRDDIEVGADCSNPRDTDGDGTPDYRDRDSDGDGIIDGLEDRDGNGVIGTCTTTCTSNTQCDTAAGENCSLPIDGATPGVCVSIACLDGESDPYNTDTDGDGVTDSGEGTFICNPQSEDNPNGLKRVQFVDSSGTMYADSNWRIALELQALIGEPTVANPAARDGAYTFDITDINAQIAGFLATRAALRATAVDESISLVNAIQNLAEVSALTQRISGTNTTSLDGFETVLSTTFQIQTGSAMDVTRFRSLIMPILLERPATDVVMPPAGWIGENDTDFIIVIQTVRRMDSTQTLYMGAVARTSMYDDRMRQTSIMADDLANGTGLTVSGNGEEVECDLFLADQQASADIIWIVDESGSVNDDAARIAANSTVFFNKAINAGLDFRIGITDMNDTGPGGQPGIFASRQGGGTGDRWLLPNDLVAFQAGINDPSGTDTGDGGAEHGLTQGRAAINRHLPRNDADPQMVRETAKLVLIYVTDEKPDEIEDAGILSEGNINPSAAQQTQINTFMAPYIADFTTNDAIAHLIAEPPPYDSPTCSSGGAEHAFGYYGLVNNTGGQIGSICQDDLSATLDAIIDSIIGEASPIVLSKFPISLSISVARDNQFVARSRDTGWDYRGASNSIIFFNMPFDPANPSDIVVSYRRWADQVPVD